ncbi:MAG: hypothetical protein HYR96_13300 [Deltaproteobacteria bacterium]|nr:hypothetical protein [Deltaproteobacteria bacterium]MBI3293769.1 hypothetical protein [Deltaproteobacteria bacterium]
MNRQLWTLLTRIVLILSLGFVSLLHAEDQAGHKPDTDPETTRYANGTALKNQFAAVSQFFKKGQAGFDVVITHHDLTDGTDRQEISKLDSKHAKDASDSFDKLKTVRVSLEDCVSRELAIPDAKGGSQALGSLVDGFVDAIMEMVVKHDRAGNFIDINDIDSKTDGIQIRIDKNKLLSYGAALSELVESTKEKFKDEGLLDSVLALVKGLTNSEELTIEDGKIGGVAIEILKKDSGTEKIFKDAEAAVALINASPQTCEIKIEKPTKPTVLPIPESTAVDENGGASDNTATPDRARPREGGGRGGAQGDRRGQTDQRGGTPGDVSQQFEEQKRRVDEVINSLNKRVEKKDKNDSNDRAAELALAREYLNSQKDDGKKTASTGPSNGFPPIGMSPMMPPPQPQQPMLPPPQGPMGGPPMGGGMDPAMMAMMNGQGQRSTDLTPIITALTTKPQNDGYVSPQQLAAQNMPPQQNQFDWMRSWMMGMEMKFQQLAGSMQGFARNMIYPVAQRMGLTSRGGNAFAGTGTVGPVGQLGVPGARGKSPAAVSAVSH